MSAHTCVCVCARERTVVVAAAAAAVVVVVCASATHGVAVLLHALMMLLVGCGGACGCGDVCGAVRGDVWRRRCRRRRQRCAWGVVGVRRGWVEGRGVVVLFFFLEEGGGWGEPTSPPEAL